MPFRALSNVCLGKLVRLKLFFQSFKKKAQLGLTFQLGNRSLELCYFEQLSSLVSFRSTTFGISIHYLVIAFLINKKTVYSIRTSRVFLRDLPTQALLSQRDLGSVVWIKRIHARKRPASFHWLLSQRFGPTMHQHWY